MRARNRVTGSPIVKSVENIQGSCRLVPDAFERDADGSITLDYEGGTELDWDSGEQATREGEHLYLDAAGEEVLESDVELYEDQ